MIEVIKDKKTWKSALNEIESHDFYHTYEYHQLAKDNDNQPILLKYVENDSHIALPLLIRKINNSSLWDATSIYGYAGPVSKNIDQNFNNKRFRKELHSFFKDQGIVSVFSRLNPFVLSQEVCLDQLGEIVFSGKVVNIDIRKKKELQRLEYQRRLKTHINKSRRLCTIKKAQSKKEVLDFVEIYYKTMHRVGAHKSYFFNENYFFNLLNSKDFETDILLALDNISKKVIGGVMLVKKSKIVHYHLSGVATEHMNKYPIKLLIDEIRTMASDEGFTYFNLGGGVGGNEDSLFRFKSSFSKDFKAFKLWKYIVDQDKYEELVKMKNEIKCNTINSECSGYFPCYRCNL